MERLVVVWGDGRNRTDCKWAQGRKDMGETMSTLNTINNRIVKTQNWLRDAGAILLIGGWGGRMMNKLWSIKDCKRNYKAIFVKECSEKLPL